MVNQKLVVTKEGVSLRILGKTFTVPAAKEPVGAITITKEGVGLPDLGVRTRVTRGGALIGISVEQKAAESIAVKKAAQAAAEEVVTREAEKKRLGDEARASTVAAKQRFTQEFKSAQTRTGREQARQRFFGAIREAELGFVTGRVAAGFIEEARFPGVRIGREEAEALLRLRGGERLTEAELKRLEERGLITVERPARREEIPLVVSPVEKPKGRLEKLERAIRERGERLEIARIRGEKIPREEVAKEAVGEFTIPFIGVTKLAKSIITEPTKTAGQTVKGISEVGRRAATTGFPEVGRFIRERPVGATGRIVGEIALAKVLGKTVQKTSDVVSATATRLSPKFRPVERLPSGREVIRKIPSKVPREIPLEIEISPPVSRITKPLRVQIRQAGTVRDVVSAQRSLFGRISRRTVKVEKPRVPGSPELERALFVDPTTRLRISRLGVLPQKEAKLLDIISGDVTFRRARPQAVLFERVKVAKFPKGLKDVEKALKAGKTLTPSQARRLEKFQLMPTGEFKPVGFLTREPELVLAPGEIIRKRGVPAVTVIKGRRVPIIRAEVIKAPKLIDLNSLPSVDKLLEIATKPIKETGRLARLDISRPAPSRPFVSPTRLGVSATLSVARISRAVTPRIRRRDPRVTKRIPRPIVPRITPRDISPSLTARDLRRITRPTVTRPAPRIIRPLVPRPVPVAPVIFPRRRKKKKPKERRIKPIEESARISEGFISKVLELGKIEKLTRKEVLQRVRKGIAPLGVRKIPIIIPDVPKKNRRKRKRRKNV